ARALVHKLPAEGKWPCLFTRSDTTGEKDFEEFFTDEEILDMERFNNLGVIKNELHIEEEKLEMFETTIDGFKTAGSWDKKAIVDLCHCMIPDFGHKEAGKYLDAKM